MMAKEGLVMHLRGAPQYLTLPKDLPDRMVDYVLHVLAALVLLVATPGEL
jgi:hypothetical protein